MLNLRKSSSTANFKEEQLKFLQLIADQAAIAIENARLYDLESQRAKELEQLNYEVTFEKLKLECVLKSLADGVMVLNEKEEVVLINTVLEKIFGFNSNELKGKSYTQLINNEDFTKLISKMKVNKQGSIQIPLGKERIFEIVPTFIKDFSDKPWGKVIVFHDITHMSKMQKLKSDVVSMVSHELRTPLTSIIGFADILIRKELDNKRRKKYLSIIQEESSRLLDLINDLLDQAKLEAGYYDFKKEEVNLIDLIDKAVDMVSNYSDKHLIKKLIPEKVSYIIGDNQMLYRVITNLLSNAIKYSPAGGNIILELNERSDCLELTVEDQGIGIPEGEIRHLFEKFYRVDKNNISGIKGTGLGLANVKYILDAHAGSIGVESEIAKGSTFTFCLPKERKVNED